MKLLNGSGSAYKNTDIDEKKKLAEIVEFLNNHVKDPKLNRENGLDVDSMLSVITEEGVHKNNDLWVKLKENIKPTNSKNENKVELTPEGLKTAIETVKQTNPIETNETNNINPKNTTAASNGNHSIETNPIETGNMNPTATGNVNYRLENTRLREVPTRFFENTSFKRASKPPRQGKFSLT